MNALKKSVLALAAAAAIGLSAAVPANAAPVAPALAVTAAAPKVLANDKGDSLGINESYTKLATLYSPVKTTKIYLTAGKNGPAKGSKSIDMQPGMMLFTGKNINKTWALYWASDGRDNSMTVVGKRADFKKLTFGHAETVRKTVGKGQDFKTKVRTLSKGQPLMVANLQVKGRTFTAGGWVKTADLKGKSIGRYTTVRSSTVYDDAKAGKRLASVKKGARVEVRKTATVKIKGKQVKVAVLTTGNYVPFKDLKKTGSFVSKLK